MKIYPRHRAPPVSRRWRGVSFGFSLVETVIAVGIVATTLLPLIALLGTTTRSQLASTDRMVATLIAAAVFEELAASVPQPALFVGTPQRGGQLNRVAIVAANSHNREVVVHFIGAVEGGLIEAIDEGVFESGYRSESGSQRPATILALEFTAVDDGEADIQGGGGLVRVRLSVEYPADAARADRRKQVFETFLNLSGG